MENFEIIKPLGQGSFGTVFYVLRKSDNNFYALKRVKISEMSQSDQEHALNEVRVLASFTHQNIISYKECFFSENTKTLDIIMEYAENGDLSSKIKESKKEHLLIQENFIWNIFFQICFGLKALHDKKFIHRDLKSANIFLCSDNVAKIGDFNVSKRLKYTPYLQSQTGTPYYASPEIWLERPYDMRTDMWSLGCIIYELCTLKVPFRAKSISSLSKAVIKGVYEPIPNIYSKDLKRLIAFLLNVDMRKRPNVDQILSCDFIKEKMKELNLSLVKSEDKLLDSIKLPKRTEDLAKVLPKIQKYSTDTDLITINLNPEEKKNLSYPKKNRIIFRKPRRGYTDRINQKKVRSFSTQTRNDNLVNKIIETNIKKSYKIPLVSINLTPIKEVKGDIVRESVSTESSGSNKNENIVKQDYVPLIDSSKILRIHKFRNKLRNCSPINIKINYNQLLPCNEPNECKMNLLHLKK